MKKTIIITALSFALASMIGVSVFAEETGTMSPQRQETTMSASNITPADLATKIACVGTAVNAREMAIDSAEMAFTTAANTAYTARATALKDAYTKTTWADVKTTVRKAWSDFKTAMKTAKKTWQTAKTAAWSTFRTAAKACKAPGSVIDNSSSESSGL